MKVLFALLLTAAACVAQSGHVFSVRPDSTRANVGRVDFWDKQATGHRIELAAPDTVAADILFRLPGTIVAGCWQNDSMGVITTTPCTNYWSRSGGFLTPTTSTDGLNMFGDILNGGSASIGSTGTWFNKFYATDMYSTGFHIYDSPSGIVKWNIGENGTSSLFFVNASSFTAMELRGGITPSARVYGTLTADSLVSGGTADVCATSAGLLTLSGCPANYWSRSGGFLTPTTTTDGLNMFGDILNAGSASVGSVGTWFNKMYSTDTYSTNFHIYDSPSGIVKWNIGENGTSSLFFVNASSFTAMELRGGITPSARVYGALTADSLAGFGVGIPVVTNNSGLLSAGGTAWTAYTPTPTYSGGTIAVSATDCAWAQSGKTVTARCHLTFTVSASVNPSNVIVPLPTTPASNGQALVANSWNSTCGYSCSDVPPQATFSGATAVVSQFGGWTTGTTWDLVLTGSYQTT